MTVYDSIDNLPVSIFDKIRERRDLQLLMIDKDDTPDPVELQKIWRQIEDEFIDFFGVNPDLFYSLNLQKQIVMLENKYVRFKKSIDYSHLYMFKQKLEEFMSKKGAKRQSFLKDIIAVEKHMGFRVDENETTVKRFYGYLLDINETIKQSKKNG